MSRLSIYLASAYQSRELIRGYAEELGSAGMLCTSSWLNEQHDITPGTSGAANDLPTEQVRKHVQDDFADIDRADVLVLFTKAASGHQGGGGRHVETGYALAKRKHVIVVGESENVFHRGACLEVEDWHAALIALVRIERRNNMPRELVETA